MERVTWLFLCSNHQYIKSLGARAEMSHFNWFKQGIWLTVMFLCPTADKYCRRSTSLFRHFILTYLIQKLLPYRFLLFEVVALWSDFLQVRIGNIWSSTDCVNILNQETTYSIVFALAISILLITHIFRWGDDYLVSLFHIFFFYKKLKDFDCVFTYQKYQNVLTENLL